tara:strand:+ start:652 stop:1038 length:387 start_codon:yes stop_codon:yes gene_type:complete
MEKVKKYFQFSGTINGLNYFLRNMLSYVVAFTGGYMVGDGILNKNTGLTSVGFLIIAPAIAFGFATLYKRMLALFDDDATSYTIGIILIQIISQLMESGPFKTLAGLFMLIFSCILIFQNSKIENHNG